MTEVVVKSKNGIHARPASMIADLSSKFAGEVALIKNGKRVNGKSIMSIMSMGLQENDVISVDVTGEGATGIEQKLVEIIDSIAE